MKKDEIKEGGCYQARVSNKLTTVRVDAINNRKGQKVGSHKYPAATTYSCTNLTTGKKVHIKSAQKFRKEVHPKHSTDMVAPGESLVDTINRLSTTGAQTRRTSGLQAPDPDGLTGADLDAGASEAEQRSDPTQGSLVGKKGYAPWQSLSKQAGPVGMGALSRGVEENAKTVSTTTSLQRGLFDSLPMQPGVHKCSKCNLKVIIIEDGDVLPEGDSKCRHDFVVEKRFGVVPLDSQRNGGTSKPFATPHSVVPSRQPTQPSNATSTTARTTAAGATPVSQQGKQSPLASLLQKSVNQQQQREVGSPHIIVVAKAGTGKTTTLVTGVINMFRHKIPKLWGELTKRMGFELIPSPQQQAVWDAMATSSWARTVQFAAFNTTIVKEFEDKWGWVIQMLGEANIEFAFNSMHSLGYKAVRRAYRGTNIDVDKYHVQNLIAQVMTTELRYLKDTKPLFLSAAEELVGLCKQNLVGLDESPSEADLADLASYYQIDMDGCEREVFDMVPQILDLCKDPTRDGIIDYNDQLWLPLVLKLPVWRNDLLLVDEAQDLNRAQQGIAKLSGKRLIVVGDPRQAIYGFAGADAESMPRLEKELGACIDNMGHTWDPTHGSSPCPKCGKFRGSTDGVGCIKLSLTVTRRCGKAIVKDVNDIEPELEAHESNCEGKITMAKFGGKGYTGPTYHSLVEDGDMILCRINAPLVSECFKFLKEGKKAFIQGRDVANGLISTIKGRKAKSLEDLITKVDDWVAKQISKEKAKKRPNEAKIIALQDRGDCIHSFAEGADSVDGVIRNIERVFSNETGKVGIRLSSVHKAKGLEAKRVIIIQPKGASMPHPMAKSPMQREQENNLIYVAKTRAIEELVKVS